MSDTLIKVENVSKKFCLDLKTSLWYGLKDIGNEMIGKKNQFHDVLREKEFWAVKDISFEVKRGECLGIIGKNGAGKSTLLKMLNGLIKPDEGRIEMHGRVGALIELGAGFNPILTGRENIFNNAAVLGFTKEETQQKLEAIIDFSEIRDFIDTPVQNYSSGMRVRLGFAIAAQLEPDVLLIDEVLAVGDMGFVYKCYNKIDEILPKTAIIFISHSMPQIARMCSNILVMNKGIEHYNGDDVTKGISFYYDLFENKKGNFQLSETAEIEEIFLSSNGRFAENEEIFTINHGDDLNVHIKINFKNEVERPSLFLNFIDKEQRSFGETVNFTEFINIEKANGILNIVASFSKIQFGQGLYSITLILRGQPEGRRTTLFRIQSAIFFKVNSNTQTWAPMEFEPVWKSL
ncbi:MAG: polysaccharide ABC transporter ATP-binding protein [Bacteroidales bacterium]